MTSSLAGEGKSTTSANLACMLAQDNERVILVDADLRRPSVARHLGLEGAVGLATVLGKEVQVSEAIQRWDAGGIDVLCSGALPPNPSALLGSETMAALLADLRAEYDWVVLDGVPLLAVNDAATLSRLCDGTLLVVNSRKVHRRQLARALRGLELVGSNVVGLVLNRTTRERGATYYSSIEDLGGPRRWWEHFISQQAERLRGTRRPQRHAPRADVHTPAPGRADTRRAQDSRRSRLSDQHVEEEFGGWLPDDRSRAVGDATSSGGAGQHGERRREGSNVRRP